MVKSSCIIQRSVSLSQPALIDWLIHSFIHSSTAPQTRVSKIKTKQRQVVYYRTVVHFIIVFILNDQSFKKTKKNKTCLPCSIVMFRYLCILEEKSLWQGTDVATNVYYSCTQTRLTVTQ